jgi:septum site-determining protein MinD
MTTARKPFTIRICSQKGGEGRTIIAINMAVALATLGHKVLLIDADPHSGGVIDALGLEDGKVSFRDVFERGLDVKQAIRRYDEGNIDLMTQNFAYKPYSPKPELVPKMASQIIEKDYDFVIVDSASAHLVESLADYYTEFIDVLKPLPNNFQSELIMIKKCDRLGVICRIVMNDVGRNVKTEISKDDVESILSRKVDMVIPHDPLIYDSVNKRKPLYLLDRDAPFSKAIEKLAQMCVKSAQKNNHNNKT